jgi:hypothetical protein
MPDTHVAKCGGEAKKVHVIGNIAVVLRTLNARRVIENGPRTHNFKFVKSTESEAQIKRNL